MKLGFPLAAAAVSRVIEALGVAPSPLTREGYTLDQLRAELVAPSGAVRAVPVHKRRVRYTLGGCKAETADLDVGGRDGRTIAIESEDPSAVIAAVRGVGLGASVNTSYPRGLAALVDAGPARYRGDRCRDELGQVPRRRAPRRREVANRRRPRRADAPGRGPPPTTRPAEPLERTLAAIAGMVEEARRLGVRAIAAAGTAGLRVAHNRDDVLAAILARTGLAVDVIPGEEEGGSPTSRCRPGWA